MADYWILLWGFVILISLFAISIVIMLSYCGLFTRIEVETSKPPIGSCYIAYKDGTGPYSNAGFFFTESTSIAPSLTQMGIYYDDPAKVSEENFRWIVGCILAENEAEADADIRAAYEKEHYKFMNLPAVKASVNSVFPYVTMLSIFIAVKRVYPALAYYIAERKLEAYPMIEVYRDGNIHFMAPLSDQMQFYSSKAMESEEVVSPIAEESTAPSVQMSSPPLVTTEPPTDGSDSDSSFEKVNAEAC